ncbi:MAG: molybdopterin-synthase adenylyltransferase MoeB [Gammaproteobacteria bacterium]|nr:MAG: molybdopterin-synthase adenylyltransferase MoeB [Gammaproteobacteria bacterium]
MNDEQLLRYSRQIMLPAIDIDGQEKLLHSKVLIIGLGGLGSPVAMYLAAAGVGQLTLVDPDQVDLSNLQRQVIHETSAIGQDKVSSAQARLRQLNPDCNVRTLNIKLHSKGLADEIGKTDAVVDCSDNFDTRFEVNAACFAAGKALISGAVIRMEGQVSVFMPRTDSPCYQCLYPEGSDTETTCSETGVLAPVAGIIGSIQATETLKVLLNHGEILSGRLLVMDASTMEWRRITLKKDPACPICSTV